MSAAQTVCLALLAGAAGFAVRKAADATRSYVRVRRAHMPARIEVRPPADVRVGIHAGDRVRVVERGGAGDFCGTVERISPPARDGLVACCLIRRDVPLIVGGVRRVTYWAPLPDVQRLEVKS